MSVKPPLPQLTMEQAEWWVKALVALFRDRPFSCVTHIESTDYAPQVRTQLTLEQAVGCNGGRHFAGFGVCAHYGMHGDGGASITLCDHDTCHVFPDRCYLSFSEYSVVCRSRAPIGAEVFTTFIKSEAPTDEEKELWWLAKQWNRQQRWDTDVYATAKRMRLFDSRLAQVYRRKRARAAWGRPDGRLALTA